MSVILCKNRDNCSKQLLNKDLKCCSFYKDGFCREPYNKVEKNEINFYFRKKEYGWLSNFERAPQILGEYEYPTNEHFYQSMKAADIEILEWIAKAPNPFLAMMAGRALRKGKELIENWDNLKVKIMREGLKAKFTQNEDLKQKLLATGDAILHEDSPNDMFWGKKGKDWLGKLIMQVRKDIREEADGK